MKKRVCINHGGHRGFLCVLCSEITFFSRRMAQIFVEEKPVEQRTLFEKFILCVSVFSVATHKWPFLKYHFHVFRVMPWHHEDSG
jgi:hypothetical protein